MTQLNYSAGNTANLVGDGNARMVDISGPFSDLSVFLNAAVMDSTDNLAASTFAAYKTIHNSTIFIPAAIMNAADKYYGTVDVGGIKSGNASTGVPPILYIDPADYTLAGRTAKLRLAISTVCDGTGVNITYGLYPVTVAGNYVVTLGTVVSGSTVTRNTPTVNTAYRDVTSDFNVPSAGAYVPGVATSAALAANSNLSATIIVQQRWT